MNETFEHGADIGVRGTGATPAEAFAECARALTSVICDPALVRERESVSFGSSAPDAELLLVQFLNDLVFEMATRRMLFARCDVRIDGQSLRAVCHGEPIEVSRHRPAVEVKGATFTELRVAQVPGAGWVAQTVVDV